MPEARPRDWKVPMLTGGICKEYRFIFQNKDRHAPCVHNVVV